jgi:ERCC4-type nuclease
MFAHIIYDDRESRSITEKMFERYREKYNTYDIRITKQRITTSDFIICINNTIFSIIERKTLEDFRGSMIDGRLDEQINRLIEKKKESGYHIFLLLEGSCFYKQDKEFRGTTFRQLDAKKRSIMYDGVPIIHSRDPEYTVEQIILIAVDALTREKKRGAGEQDQEESKEEMIAIIPPECVVPNKKKPAQTLFNMWCALPGVSIKTAPILMQYYSLNEFFQLSDLSIKEIGTKRCQNILDKSKEAKHQMRVLAEVQGISVGLAEEILKIHKIYELPKLFQYKSKKVKKPLESAIELLSDNSRCCVHE